MECNFENCGYYTDGECNICGMGISGEDTFCRLCKDNPKCYYKQRQRLEQENAELRKDIKACNTCERSAKIYGNENAELKAENKELAHYLACMTEQRNKANTCLQEIKEIAEADVHIVGDEKLYYDSIEQILDLITKAEEE